MGTERQSGKMKRVLEMDSGDGCTTMWICYRTVHLKIAETGIFYILPQFFKNEER